MSWNTALPVKSPAAQEQIWTLAESLLPPGQARAWNQALMEFGALICRRGTPDCRHCPLTDVCLSYRTDSTGARPVVGPGQQTIAVSLVAAVIVAGNMIYVQQRPAKVRWASLWEFPGGELLLGEPPSAALLRQVKSETGLTIGIQRPLPAVTHNYTRYKATVQPFLCHLPHPATPSLRTAREYRWLPLADLNSLAFSAGHRQVIDTLAAFVK